MTTKTPVNELAERVLKSHGWALGPEFWQRVTSDPFVFQLVAVIEREAVQTDELRSALSDAADAFEECTGDYAQELASDDLVRWRRLAGVEDTTGPTLVCGHVSTRESGAGSAICNHCGEHLGTTEATP